MKLLQDGLRTHSDNWIRALTRELEINSPSYRESKCPGTYIGTGNYDFKLYIWKRERKPFWFVAVPCQTAYLDKLDLIEDEEKRFGTPTLKARYELTGRVFYDCRNGPSKEFAYEYEFRGVK